jgi:hypothetical protein
VSRSVRTRFKTAGIPRQSIVDHGTSELLISAGTGDTPDVKDQHETEILVEHSGSAPVPAKLPAVAVKKRRPRTLLDARTAVVTAAVLSDGRLA